MKRFLSPVFKVAVTVVLFYWIFSKYGLRNIGSHLASARLDLFGLGIGVFILSNFIGARQWQRLLQGLGISFPYKRAASLYFIGLFFNPILPSSLGGDVVKIYSISKVEKRGKEGLAATFVDRFAGFFLLSLFAIGSSIYLLHGHLLHAQGIKNDILVYIAIIFFIFVLVAAILFSRRVGRLIYEVLLARFNPLGLKEKFREVHGFFHAYRHNYKLAVEVFFLSLAIQLARVSVHYFCALSIGFDIDFVYFLIFVPLIAMVAVIPVSFGGIGVREGIAPFLFTSVTAVAAVDPAGSLAVTTQILASLVGVVVGLAGGVLFLFTKTSGEIEIPEGEEEVDRKA